MLGPTASGKTEMVRILAKALSSPLAIVDASRLAPTSYRGEDVSSIFKDLITAADGDVQKAERGIIFLDEFDKIAFSGHEDLSHLRKLQSELLTLLEGKPLKLKFGTGLNEEEVHFNPQSVLFIAAGAFSGLKEKNLNAKNFGLNTLDKNEAHAHEANLRSCLVEYGIMPELLGRFPLLTRTKELSDLELMRLLEDKAVFSLTEYYLNLFKKEGVKVSLSEGFKKSLCLKAKALGMGVRGLQGLVESQMMELLYSLESLKGQEIVLTEEGFSTNSDVISIYSKVLNKTRLGKSLPQRAISLFCSEGELKKIKAGETLMGEGDTPDNFFVLLDGHLRATNSQGLNVLRGEPGCFFGEFGFLHGKKRTATVKAETDARLLKFSNEKLRRLIDQNPELGLKLVMLFSETALERSAA